MSNVSDRELGDLLLGIEYRSKPLYLQHGNVYWGDREVDFNTPVIWEARRNEFIATEDSEERPLYFYVTAAGKAWFKRTLGTGSR